MKRAAVWVLVVFVFSIPSENGVTIAGLGSLSRLIGILAFGVAVMSLYGGGRLRLRTPSLFVVATAVFLLWGVATYFWSVVPGATMSRMFTMAQLGVLVWLVHQVPRSERDRDLLRQGFVLGCYVIVVIGVVAFVTTNGSQFRDVGNFNPNGFAIVLSLAIPMAWGLMLRGTFGTMRWLNAAYPLFALVGVVLAASRGGLLTYLVALAVIPATLGQLGLLRRVVLFAAVAAAAWGLFTWVPAAMPNLQGNLERLAETDEELASGTLTGRTIIWQAGLEVFGSSPVVGVGLGGFGESVRPILGRARAPHNAFLSVAVGSGLVGLTLFVFLFAIVFVGIVANPHRRVEHLVLLFALIVGMMPTNSDNDKFAWLILALLASSGPIGLRIGPPGLLPFGSRPVARGTAVANASVGTRADR